MNEELLEVLKKARDMGANRDQLKMVADKYKEKNSFENKFSMYSFPMGGIPNIVTKPKEEMNAFESGLATGGASVAAHVNKLDKVFDQGGINAATDLLGSLEGRDDKELIDGVPVGEWKKTLGGEIEKKTETVTADYLRSAKLMTMAENKNVPTSLAEIKNFKDFTKFAAHSVGQAIPQMGATIGSGGLAIFAIEAGTIQMEMIEKAVQDDNGLDTAEEVIAKAYIDPQWAVGAGLVAGGLDLLSLGKIAGMTGMTKLARSFTRKGAKELIENTTKKQASKSILNKVTKGTVSAMATEGITEGLQGEVEEFGSAMGSGTKYQFDANRLATGIAAGLITGGALGSFGSTVSAVATQEAMNEVKDIHAKKAARTVSELIGQEIDKDDPTVKAQQVVESIPDDVSPEIEKKSTESVEQTGVVDLTDENLSVGEVVSSAVDDIKTIVQTEETPVTPEGTPEVTQQPVQEISEETPKVPEETKKETKPKKRSPITGRTDKGNPVREFVNDKSGNILREIDLGKGKKQFWLNEGKGFKKVGQFGGKVPEGYESNIDSKGWRMLQPGEKFEGKAPPVKKKVKKQAKVAPEYTPAQQLKQKRALKQVENSAKTEFGVKKALTRLQDKITKYGKEFPDVAAKAQEQIDIINQKQADKVTKKATKEDSNVAEKTANVAVKKSKAARTKTDRSEALWNSIKNHVTDLKQVDFIISKIDKKLKDAKEKELLKKEVRKIRKAAKEQFEFRGSKDMKSKAEKLITKILKGRNDPDAKSKYGNLIEYMVKVKEALTKPLTPQMLDNAKQKYVSIQKRAFIENDLTLLDTEEFDMLGYQLLGHLPKEAQEGVFEDIKHLTEHAKVKSKEFMAEKARERQRVKDTLMETLIGQKELPRENSAAWHKMKRKYRVRRNWMNKLTYFFDTWSNLMDALGVADIGAAVRKTKFNKEFFEREARNNEIKGQRKWHGVLANKYKRVFLKGIKGLETDEKRILVGKVDADLNRKEHEIKWNLLDEEGNYIKDENGETVTENFEKVSWDNIMYMWSLTQMETIRESILEDETLGQDFIDEVNKKIKEKPEAQEYAEFLVKEFYPTYFPDLNKAYMEKTGKPLIYTKDYSPLMLLPDASTNTKDIDKSMQGLMGHFPVLTTMTGFVKPKIAGKMKNTVDFTTGAIGLASKYVIANEHFKAYDKLVTKMNAFFGDSEVRRAIAMHFGNEMNYVLDIKRKHLAYGRIIHSYADTLFDKLRTNAIVASIGAIPNLAIKQMTSLFGFTTEMPTMPKGVGKSYAGYMAEFFNMTYKGQQGVARSMFAPLYKMVNLFHDNPFLQERIKRGNRSVDEAIIHLRGSKFLFGERIGRRALSDYTMAFIRTGDMGAILIGGYPVYRAHYDLAISEGKTPEQAEKVAQEKFMDVTLNTQQSGEIADIPAIKDSPTGRLVTSFLSTPMQYGSNVRAGARAVRRAGGIKNAMKTRAGREGVHKIFMYGVILPMIFQHASQAFRMSDDDEDDILRKRIFYAPIDNFFNGLGYIGWALNALTRKLATGEDLTRGNSFIIDEFRTALSDFMTDFENVKDTGMNRDIVLSLLHALGLSTGLPLGNIGKLGANAHDVVVEGDDPRKLLLYSDYALNTKDVKDATSNKLQKVQMKPKPMPKPKPAPKPRPKPRPNK